MKVLNLILSGIAHEPIEELDGKTPLEVAKTPYLDKLAKEGEIGRLQAVPENLFSKTSRAAMAIMGYDPKADFLGEGPLYAAAKSFVPNPDEVVFAFRFVTFYDGKIVDARAGGTSDREQAALIEGLSRVFKLSGIRFDSGIGSTHLAMVKSPAVFDHYNSWDLPTPEEFDEKFLEEILPRHKSVEFLKQFLEEAGSFLETHDVNKVRVDLKENPANFIWAWGAGITHKIPDFNEKTGLKGAVMSKSPLWRGLAHEAKMTFSDFNIQKSAELLSNHDWLYVSCDDADQAACRHDFRHKVRVIESLDNDYVRPALEIAQRVSSKLIVTSGDDGPYAAWGDGVRASDSEGFSENAASKSGKHFTNTKNFLNEVRGNP
jgi:2,3-bisphosphoglycerate-independent phosphoglycerate mutase